MQELYFRQLRNRDVGPLSANQIRQMIRTGQIQASDRLRVDGEAVALPAAEYLAFQSELESTVAQEANGRRWVCMLANQMNQGPTAAMCGPYNRKEIIGLLMRGDLKSTDYVWREGYSSWRKLETVDQLQLPIPRTMIKWNSGALDWMPARNIPLPAPSLQTAAPNSTLADSLLDAAIVLVCGLFALVVWKLAFPTHRASSVAATYRPTAKVTASQKPVYRTAPFARRPVPPRAPQAVQPRIAQPRQNSLLGRFARPFTKPVAKIPPKIQPNVRIR